MVKNGNFQLLMCDVAYDELVDENGEYKDGEVIERFFDDIKVVVVEVDKESEQFKGLFSKYRERRNETVKGETKVGVKAFSGRDGSRKLNDAVIMATAALTGYDCYTYDYKAFINNGKADIIQARNREYAEELGSGFEYIGQSRPRTLREFLDSASPNSLETEQGN